MVQLMPLLSPNCIIKQLDEPIDVPFRYRLGWAEGAMYDVGPGFPLVMGNF